MLFLMDIFLGIFLFRQWRQDIAVDAHKWCLRAIRAATEAQGAVQESFLHRDHHWSRLVALN